MPQLAVLEDRPSNLPTRLADGLGLESGLEILLPDLLRPVLGIAEESGSPASSLRKEAGIRRQLSKSLL